MKAKGEVRALMRMIEMVDKIGLCRVKILVDLVVIGAIELTD